MSISLIIPAYNEEKYIGACLDFALKHADSFITEIIVVDNASTDKTYDIVSEYASKYPIIIVVKENQKGITRARQKGFLEAKSDILAYIDADTQMPKGWAKKMKKQFEADDKVGFVSGPCSYYNSTRYQQVANWMYRRTLGYPGYLLVGYLGVGGNFAIKKSLLQLIGGFDTNIAFYGEDTDIARRAAAHSKVKFLLDINMPTSSRRFISQGILKTIYLYTINFLSQVIRHKPTTFEYEDYR